MNAIILFIFKSFQWLHDHWKVSLAILIALAFINCFWRIYSLTMENRALEKENSRHTRNIEILAKEKQSYKVRDSLSAIKVDALLLKVDEYQKLRFEDNELINEATDKVEELERVVKSQTKTIHELRANVRDSIVYVRDSVPVEAQCFDIKDKWYNFNGCIVEGKFEGQYFGYDSLMVIETVTHKHFLGIDWLWKLKGIRSRQVSVVSKNPHTIIEDTEYIQINR